MFFYVFLNLLCYWTHSSCRIVFLLVTHSNVKIDSHEKSRNWWLETTTAFYYAIFKTTYRPYFFLLITLNAAFSVPTVTWKITILKLSKPVRFINCTRSTQCKLMLDCLSQMKFIIDNDTSTSGLILDTE